MIDIDSDYLILLVLYQFLLLGLVLKRQTLGLDKLPNIVLRNMVRVERTARDLVEKLALWKFNFMGV